jgi:hypothetical protein
MTNPTYPFQGEIIPPIPNTLLFVAVGILLLVVMK